MRDLSLHILDLMENSIRAGASIVSVTVDEKAELDELDIAVEDNGVGLNVSPEQAMDPYYTTKRGKRTGLGLSLFRAAVEQADGELDMGKSRLGGVSVRATMRLSHIDRQPLGDLAATFSSMVCTNPFVEFRLETGSSHGHRSLQVSEVARELGDADRCGLVIARRVSREIKTGLMAMTA